MAGEMTGPVVGPTGAWGGASAWEHHSWSPQLASFIGDLLRGQEDAPVYDFGCGLGHYLAALEPRGFKQLIGIEKDPPENSVLDWSKYLWQDLTKPFEFEKRGNVLFLEVAEHVPAFFEDVMLDNVTGAVGLGCFLVMSWAVRGQGGDGHVNELDAYEVLPRIFRRGFEIDAEATRKARACITQSCWWFKQSLFVFKRVT
jgi:SAM-dependent methyltransferase